MGKGRGFVTGVAVFLDLGSTVLKDCKNVRLKVAYSPKSLQPETREVSKTGEHGVNTYQHSWQLSKAEQHKRSWRKGHEEACMFTGSFSQLQGQPRKAQGDDCEKPNQWTTGHGTVTYWK